MTEAPFDPARAARRALRERLLAERERFLAAPAAAAAAEALAATLRQVIAELEPECLGLYCAFRSEFNAAAAIVADPRFKELPLALPYARRTPKSMEFRRWDGAEAPELALVHGLTLAFCALLEEDPELARRELALAAAAEEAHPGGYLLAGRHGLQIVAE